MVLLTAGLIVFSALAVSACHGERRPVNPSNPQIERGVQPQVPENRLPETRLPGAQAPGSNLSGGENGGEGNSAPYAEEPNLTVREGYITGLDREWRAAYDRGAILDALNRIDAHVATLSHFGIAQRNSRDCATTMDVGGTFVGAYEFKEALGLDSTLITAVTHDPESGEFVFTGKGKN